jgi:uncharacterized peroxidase-related enzyme
VEDFREESADELKANHMRHDWRLAELSDVDQALCAWAEKVTIKIQEVSRADVDSLREAGLSEDAISDAAQVIGFFNYINRIAESLGVDLEPDMPPKN